jgi:hypothetical protein
MLLFFSFLLTAVISVLMWTFCTQHSYGRPALGSHLPPYKPVLQCSDLFSILYIIRICKFSNEILLQYVRDIIGHKGKYPFFCDPVGFPVNVIMQVYGNQKF